MRFLRSLIPSVLVLGAGIAEAASSWSFDEAIISVNGKGAGVGAGFKDKYVANTHAVLLNCMLLSQFECANSVSADYLIMSHYRNPLNSARQTPSRSS
jgi:hypothetical protein